MSASAISISTYPLLWLAILLGGWAVFKTPVYFFQIDQRRVDVLCDHDQKVPTKGKCLCVCLSVCHITFLSGYICSDTLRMF